MIDTMDVLSQADIQYVGAGHNIDEAMAQYILKYKGKPLPMLQPQGQRNIE